MRSIGSAVDHALRSGAVTLALAVDIGATKMEVGLVDQDGQVLTARRGPTDPVDPWSVLARLVDEVLEAAPQEPVACGCGSVGPMTPGGETVSPLNVPAWREFPLRSRLAAACGLPTVVDNDAKALAVGEGWRGAAQGVSTYLAMVVSTGVGGGLVVDGRLLHGVSGNAGHIGHVVVVADGRACACGSRGCLEAEASGTAIAARLGRPAALADPTEVERAGTLVGRAVADVAVLLDLHLVVIAGSVALGFGAPFFEAARAEVARRARISYVRDVAIRPAGLGDRGPIVGAAGLVIGPGAPVARIG